MTRVLNGMHLSNRGQHDIEQMCRVAPGAVTCLHFQLFPHDTMSDNTGDFENEYWYGKLRWGWEPQGIAPGPDRLIHIRFYQSQWSDWDPREVARRAVPLLANWRSAGREGPVLTADLWQDPLVCVSPCNEQNLEAPDHLKHDYAYQAHWQLVFWDELDKLVPDRRSLDVLGAWAFGHDAFPDVPDSEYQVPEVRELCERVDVLATHPYALFNQPDGGAHTADPERDGYWCLLRDFRPEGWRDRYEPNRPHDPGGILAQIPDKPLLITETGTFAHGDASRNNDTLAAFRMLYSVAQQSGRCIGVTPFIWNSGDEHAANRIWPNEQLRRGLEELPGYVTSARLPVHGEEGGGVADKMAACLQSAGQWDDIRNSLAQNPNGPNGAFGRLPADNVEAIVVHHTAVSSSTTWDAIANYHVNTREYAGIGYHLGVRNGRLAYLGDIGTARAHVLGQNHRYIGIAVAGNFENQALSDGDLQALRRAVAAVDCYLGRKVPVRGHRDVTPPGYTVCPGRYLHARLGEIRGDPTDTLALALRKWADVAQAIQPNEQAALYRQIRSDGFWPISDESGSRDTPRIEGHNVVAQVAREWQGAGERIYWWDGTRVQWIKRHA